MADYICGNGGNNWLYGTNLEDWIFAGGGHDRLYGYGGNDRLVGEDGNDHFWGGEGDDVMSGGRGHDRFYGDAGADVMYGGIGLDRTDYSQSDEAVSVDLGRGIGRLGDAEGDTYDSIEISVGSDYGDSFTGRTRKTGSMPVVAMTCYTGAPAPTYWMAATGQTPPTMERPMPV